MGSCMEDGPGAVRAVMEKYTEAVFNADIDTLRTLVHPGAFMNGYLGDDLLVGGIEPFYEDLQSRPSMAEAKDPLETQISGVEVNGRIATATLVETGFFGAGKFANYFTLLFIDGEWKILTKTFASL